MQQELRRQVPEADGNGWDRYYDAGAGAGVVYENRPKRKTFGYVNGVAFAVDWPDCGTLGHRTDGELDHGQALAYRLRPEYDNGRVTGWFLYTYMFSGNSNPRTEWVAQVA